MFQRGSCDIFEILRPRQANKRYSGSQFENRKSRKRPRGHLIITRVLTGGLQDEEES